MPKEIYAVHQGRLKLYKVLKDYKNGTVAIGPKSTAVAVDQKNGWFFSDKQKCLEANYAEELAAIAETEEELRVMREALEDAKRRLPSSLAAYIKEVTK